MFIDGRVRPEQVYTSYEPVRICDVDDDTALPRVAVELSIFYTASGCRPYSNYTQPFKVLVFSKNRFA